MLVLFKKYGYTGVKKITSPNSCFFDIICQYTLLPQQSTSFSKGYLLRKLSLVKYISCNLL